MNRAIIDTDIYSEISRGKNPAVIRNATSYAQIHGRYTITAITVAELVKGLFKNRKPKHLVALLSALSSDQNLDFDRRARNGRGSSSASSSAPASRSGWPIR